MKEHKEERKEDTDADIKAEKAKVAVLNVEIETADNMTADIIEFMEEATEIRQTGKKENKLAIKDAEDAQKALQNAIAVLTTFYKESGKVSKEPWEFIQQDPLPTEQPLHARKPVKVLPSPGVWKNDPYKGGGDPNENGGILNLLETTMADFAKMEADTRSQEAMDQKEYEKAMKDSKEEKTAREQESEMKSNERKR